MNLVFYIVIVYNFFFPIKYTVHTCCQVATICIENLYYKDSINSCFRVGDRCFPQFWVCLFGLYSLKQRQARLPFASVGIQLLNCNCRWKTRKLKTAGRNIHIRSLILAKDIQAWRRFIRVRDSGIEVTCHNYIHPSARLSASNFKLLITTSKGQDYSTREYIDDFTLQHTYTGNYICYKVFFYDYEHCHFVTVSYGLASVQRDYSCFLLLPEDKFNRFIFADTKNVGTINKKLLLQMELIKQIYPKSRKIRPRITPILKTKFIWKKKLLLTTSRDEIN